MHDCNGTPLKVGDIVTLEAKVTQIAPSDNGGYCNATVEYGFDKPNEAFNMRGAVSAINSRQLLLVRKAPESPVADPDAEFPQHQVRN